MKKSNGKQSLLMVNIIFWILNYKRLEYAINYKRKIKFSVKGFFSKCDQIRDFVAFAEETLKTSVFAQWITNNQYCKVPLMKDFIANASTFMNCQD